MSNKKKYTKINTSQLIIILIFFTIFIIVSYIGEKNYFNPNTNETTNEVNIEQISYSSILDVPDYSGEICVTINDNKPYFNESDYTTNVFENYSELDYLGRCGVAYANICKEIMPPEEDERGSISSVHPSGWKQVKFDGEYLYNRCHLIAYSLSDEDANKQNLITGTRYFNVQGMLPIERLVLEYMNQNENNHVLYRVTPIFKDENLLASGVEMEGYSIEDEGKLSFNVFIYNIQPGADIDYKTGQLINN